MGPWPPWCGSQPGRKARYPVEWTVRTRAGFYTVRNDGLRLTAAFVKVNRAFIEPRHRAR